MRGKANPGPAALASVGGRDVCEGIGELGGHAVRGSEGAHNFNCAPRSSHDGGSFAPPPVQRYGSVDEGPGPRASESLGLLHQRWIVLRRTCSGCLLGRPDSILLRIKSIELGLKHILDREMGRPFPRGMTLSFFGTA